MESNESKIQQILEVVRQKDVQLTRFLYCGFDNKIRGKSVHTSKLASFLKSGVGHPWALLCFAMPEFPVEGRSFISTGEVRITPDLETFHVAPYLPKLAGFWCDLLLHDGTPWDLCPRSFLKRMLREAADLGMTFECSIETEFTLLRETEGAYVPICASDTYHSHGMDAAHMVILDIIDALADQGIQVEQFYSETGGGQEEITIHHADALKTADDQLTFRETIRNVANSHEMLVSFAPKPFPDGVGNGAHIHLSGWDLDRKTNLFADLEDEWGLSETGYQFGQGILNHAAAVLSLTAPTVNSYRRLQPSRLCSAYASFGPDNREAAVRVPSLFKGREKASANLEFRAADGSANPYLALGALIAAGLDGVKSKAKPKGLVHTDPDWLSEEERRKMGVMRFPETLGDALLALEKDEVIWNALGAALAKEYCIVKRADQEHFDQHDAEYECRIHRFKF